MTTMKSTKKSDDDSLLQNPNKILRKSKWQLAVSDIATTVAPRQRQKKTNCLLHFRVSNVKDFFMIPAMMGSREQTMMNGR